MNIENSIPTTKTEKKPDIELQDSTQTTAEQIAISREELGLPPLTNDESATKVGIIDELKAVKNTDPQQIIAELKAQAEKNGAKKLLAMLVNQNNKLTP